MYNRSIVPKNFKVPKELKTKDFILRPLKVSDLIKDYEAVMSSIDHLKGRMDDSDWPVGLTIEENLIDLGWHQREFTLGHSFAYTVTSLDGEVCLGCCYIYPSENPEIEVDVFYWTRKDRPDEGLENRLGETLEKWLKDVWPFKTFDFPGRI